MINLINSPINGSLAQIMFVSPRCIWTSVLPLTQSWYSRWSSFLLDLLTLSLVGLWGLNQLWLLGPQVSATSLPLQCLWVPIQLELQGPRVSATSLPLQCLWVPIHLELLGPRVTATSLRLPSLLDLMLYLQVQVLMGTQLQFPLHMETQRVAMIISGHNRPLHMGFQMQLHLQCSIQPLLLHPCFNRKKNLHLIPPFSYLVRTLLVGQGQIKKAELQKKPTNNLDSKLKQGS